MLASPYLLGLAFVWPFVLQFVLPPRGGKVLFGNLVVEVQAMYRLLWSDPSYAHEGPRVVKDAADLRKKIEWDVEERYPLLLVPSGDGHITEVWVKVGEE